MPDWIKRLCRPFAMPGILRYAAGFQALVFVLMRVIGQERAMEYLSALTLDVPAILRGEVWRVVSFIALPVVDPFSNLGLLWMCFAVMILFLLSDIIESHWGVDGLTAYFVLGVLFALLAGLIGGWLLPGAEVVLAFLIPSLFGSGFLFAAACLEPRLTLRVMLFLPAPLGLIAAVLAASYIFKFLQLPVLLVVLLVSQGHFLIWALPRLFHAAANARDVQGRRVRFERSSAVIEDGFHRCELCGATEISHPDRDFRVAVDGQEICSDCRARG